MVQSNRRTPTHPGVILREEFLIPYEVSAHALATALGVPPNRITDIIYGSRGIGAETAILLSRAFGTTSQFWLNLQNAYDMAFVSITEERQTIIQAFRDTLVSKRTDGFFQALQDVETIGDAVAVAQELADKLMSPKPSTSGYIFPAVSWIIKSPGTLFIEGTEIYITRCQQATFMVVDGTNSIDRFAIAEGEDVAVLKERAELYLQNLHQIGLDPRIGAITQST